MKAANLSPSKSRTEPPSRRLRVLLVGSTGAVGQQVLRQALADERIDHVIAPTRRPLPTHVKLENPVVDFANVNEEASGWHVDAVICALGTTLGKAGSREAFTAIDRDLPVQLARLARKAGATRFALNSSLGASSGGNFYLRTKAEAEQGIRDLAYPTYTIVRPSLIDARRDELRLGERAGLLAARLILPLIPRRYKPVKAESIARALLEGVMTEYSGELVIESDQLQY
jgi:uncharacterized protein YbjT (DUF2867 family)